jgi:hypothetical protein
MSTSDSVLISHILRQPSQAEIDAGLEREIETARLATLCTSDPEFQRAGADAMKRLIAQRSDARIARMEEERGLTR